MADQPRDARLRSIMQVVDELEAHVMRGRRVPGMSTWGVDGQHLLELIDELRVAVPTELEQARRVVRQRQQIITEAQDEARRIVDTARERSEYMVSDVGLMAEARQISEERLRRTDETTRRARDVVDEYALDLVGNLEQLMRRNLAEIDHLMRKNLAELEEVKRGMRNTQGSSL